jgi:CubicO group peptidase (beta-lactamase class C family)
MHAPRRLLSHARVILVLVVGAASAASAPRGSIEAFIDDAMPASGVPGVAYAVVADGDVAMAGARGVVELGSDTAVTSDTPFVIGSISKSMTALGVMQLVESGRLDLDTTLSQVLDGFSGRPAGAITVRQLLSHTSGFSTRQGNARRSDATGAVDDLARAVDRLAAVTPAFEPDETWAYSNANYQVLGRVIEVVSGQDYQTYVATHILEPVGMSHSFVADGTAHASMATGHRPWFGTKRPISDAATDRATAPQGGIVASASDLARYLGVMMNGEDDVLSAEGKALMMRPASALSPNYGLGWKLDSGTGVVWHDGVSPGVETLAMLLPAQKKAVVVLVNGGSGMGFGETSHLRVGIADRALGLGYDGGSSAWSRKALFVLLVVLPFVYLLGMIKVWVDRARVRAASGALRAFTLWFPLLTTGVAAWVLIGLVPSLFGTSIRSLMDYSPDLGLALVASGVGGVLLTGFRLVVAYTGRARPA